MTPLGEDSWKLAPGFLWTSPRAPLPFDDFALYFCAVVNHGHGYNCMPSPVSPSESPKLGVVLGVPGTLVYL